MTTKELGDLIERVLNEIGQSTERTNAEPAVVMLSTGDTMYGTVDDDGNPVTIDFITGVREGSSFLPPTRQVPVDSPHDADAVRRAVQIAFVGVP